MWIKRSHVLAPLAKLTSKETKWVWGDKEKKAFHLVKKIMARETMLAYPNFNEPFEIHTDASHYQLGAVISQNGKPIAFYSRKLNDAQTRYTTTERELLSIVETLKEYRNILLGQQVKIYTDHKNLTFKNFNIERVMQWQLFLEEFGPNLVYIKGTKNVVADALSCLDLSEKEFSKEAFAFGQQEFPKSYSLSYAQMEYEQRRYPALLQKLTDKDPCCKEEIYKHSNKTYKIITKNNKIVIPPALQCKAVE